MAWFKRENPSIRPTDKRDIPEGLWWKCEECGAMLHKKQFEDNFYTCPECSHHFRISPYKYFSILFDSDKYIEFDDNLRSADPLSFTDTKKYPDRVHDTIEKNGKTEACRNAHGECGGSPLVVSAMDFGFIGAKLYYPDNTLQHAGVIVGLRGTAGHVLTGHRGDSPGLFSRLKRVQNYSAVTGACLMMRRDIFMRVNGFSADLPVAFNDVDLCLKVREKGYLVVWTPYAELIHYESKTRGYEETPEKQERFRNEQRIFRNRWRELLAKGDPYYNRNLTLIAEDYSLRICGDNSAKGQM